MSGRLWGVGVGPGDPELLTVRAARLIADAAVVAFHSAGHGRSIARATAAPYLSAGVVEEQLVYPATVGGPEDPGYAAAMAEFYADASARLAAHLSGGRDVVVLCEGDPAFYGSYQHLHERLKDRFEATIVPGVSAVSAAAAAAGVPLVMHEETLVVAPGTLPAADLAARLAGGDAAAIFKLGRSFDRVREVIAAGGRLDRAVYVERAGTVGQRVEPLARVDADSVPYMSMALIPGVAGAQRRSSRPAGGSPVEGAMAAAKAEVAQGAVIAAGAVVGGEAGSVTVVGLGPGDLHWTTPEVSAVLAQASDLIGYTTYLARVPERPGQVRHSSENKVESERAAMALDLAARGRRVAVVSSGDPGVFAMASAVIEVAAALGKTGPNVRVLPGVTAAQAVSARVGAPLGHDYAVLSLSDRLKPWDVIESRLAAAAAADLVLAIYNPASADRRWQVAAARDVLLRYRAGTTPVVVARAVGDPAESVSIVTLAELDPETVDMRTLLIVGSSATQRYEGPSGPVVYTPRRYGG